MGEELSTASWTQRLQPWTTRLKALSLALNTRRMARSSVCVTHDALSLRMLPDWPPTAAKDEEDEEEDELEALFRDNDNERRAAVLDRWRDIVELLELCALLAGVDADAWLEFVSSISSTNVGGRRDTSTLRRDELRPCRPRCHVRIDTRSFYRGKAIASLFRRDSESHSEAFLAMRNELLTTLDGRRHTTSLALELALHPDASRSFNHEVTAFITELRQLWDKGDTCIQLDTIEISGLLPELAQASVQPLLRLGVPIAHIGLPDSMPTDRNPWGCRLGLLRLLPPAELHAIDGEAVLPSTTQRTLYVPEISASSDIESVFTALRTCSTITSLELPDVVGLGTFFWRWFAFSILERSSRHALQSISVALHDLSGDSMAAMASVLHAGNPNEAMHETPSPLSSSTPRAYYEDEERSKRLRLTPSEPVARVRQRRFARLREAVDVQQIGSGGDRHRLEFSSAVYAPIIADNPSASRLEVLCPGLGHVAIARADVAAIVDENDVPHAVSVSSASMGVTSFNLYVHHSVERGPETIHALLEHVAPLRLRVLSLQTPWTTGLYDATLARIIELFPRLEALTLRPIALVSFQPLLDAYARRRCAIRSLKLLNLKCSGALEELNTFFDALKPSSRHLMGDTLEELAIRPEQHADAASALSVESLHDHIATQALTVLGENRHLRTLMLEVAKTPHWTQHQQAALAESREMVVPLSRWRCVALLSAFHGRLSRPLAREIVLEILSFAAQPTRRSVTLLQLSPLPDERSNSNSDSAVAAGGAPHAFRRGIRRTNW